MKVGDTVLVLATVTQLGEDVVRLAISRNGVSGHVEHVRTVRSQIRPIRQVPK